MRILIENAPFFIYDISIIMKKTDWYIPEYYRNFTCKADRCRNTCCSGWRIPISKTEYYRLVTLDCSEELDRRIQRSFSIPETVTDERFRYVSFNWEGICPIQEKGLCSLHKEKGEGVLPEVCRLYPRSLKNINGHNVACCSSSCEKVVELLYEADDMSLVKETMEEEARISYTVSEEDIAQIGTFQEIIKDRSTTLAQSIADICRIINEKEFSEDYDADREPLEEGLKPLRFFSRGDDRLAGICLKVVKRYESDPSLYEKDRDLFEKRFPDWMSFFEKIINNSMIYENYPFVDERADRTGVYRGLCLCYGLLRMLCIGNTAEDGNRETLIDTVTALFRVIDHTAFYYNASVISGNRAILLKL